MWQKRIKCMWLQWLNVGPVRPKSFHKNLVESWEMFVTINPRSVSRMIMIDLLAEHGCVFSQPAKITSTPVILKLTTAQWHVIIKCWNALQANLKWIQLYCILCFFFVFHKEIVLHAVIKNYSDKLIYSPIEVCPLIQCWSPHFTSHNLMS